MHREPDAEIETDQLLELFSASEAQDEEARDSTTAYLNEIGMIFGATYQSDAVIADGTAAPAVADAVTEYVPSARPGSRAPHAWLHKRDGERVSTIDLTGNDFVLMAGAEGDAWLEAGRTAASRSGIALTPVKVGGDGLADVDGRWHDTYGIEPGGAVLVRPDGYVCWRGVSAAGPVSGALNDALAAIQGRA